MLQKGRRFKGDQRDGFYQPMGVLYLEYIARESSEVMSRRALESQNAGKWDTDLYPLIGIGKMG